MELSSWMDLRRATMEDALAVLEWRNDPATCAASKTGTVSRESHIDWFAEAVVDPDRILLIGCEDGRRIGMVRFDRDLVSINIAPDERGKGYGQRLLRQAIHEVDGHLRAEIRPDNIASIRVFERCGFVLVSHEEGFLHFATAAASLPR